MRRVQKPQNGHCTRHQMQIFQVSSPSFSAAAYSELSIRQLKVMKRKANTPLSLERPALSNVTNVTRSQSNRTSVLPIKKAVPKKLPNYLRPTISTQQKCVRKTTEPEQGKLISGNENKPLKKEDNKKPLKAKETTKRLKENVDVSKTSQPNFADQTSVSLNDNFVRGTAAEISTENLFGFEEESDKSHSEAEEQVEASPLRFDILPSRKTLPCTPKPPVNHVLSVLKSSISSPLVKTPRTVERKLPEFFHSSASQQSKASVSPFVDEPNQSFDHPPRRSYARQRPLMNFAEFDANSDDEEKEETVEPKVDEIKTKKKKKTVQDKQFEALAAAMNSQFQQVENYELAVE